MGDGMRHLLLATVLAVLGASPAAAWDYTERGGDIDTWISAYQNDDSGQYELAVTCSDLFPDDSDVAIYLPSKWDDTASYAPEAAFTVVVDGVEIGPLSARWENIDGLETIIAYETADDRVRPLFDQLRQAKTGVSVSFFDKTLSFKVNGAERMIGKFLETCDGQPAY